MYFVYILYSISQDKYYIGQTQDIANRLTEHKTRKNLGAADWEIKHLERYSTRSEATKRESEIKGKKRRYYIESLIKGS